MQKPFSKNKFFNEQIEDYLISIAVKTIKYIHGNEITKLNNKNDGTLLTAADLALDNIIYESLKKIDPSIPILSEERDFSNKLFQQQQYWLIDPIDGTNSYYKGGEEYTINIAFINRGKPIVGLIAHPPTNKIWLANKNSLYLHENQVKKVLKNSHTENLNNEFNIIVSNESNNKLKNFLSRIHNKKIIKVSSSLKFCYLAMNMAHLYPRFSIIKKWDIAAGHAILEASGGVISDLEGKNFNYSYPSEESWEFLAYSSVGCKNKGLFISKIKNLR